MNGIFIGNRSVRLTGLYQWRTYEGLLEGLPTDRLNVRILTGLPERAKQYCDGNPIVILDAVQTPIPYERRYPFGEPMSLPGTVCVANFNSHQPARNQDADASSLTVVWFQEDWALPIDSSVLEQLRGVDWDRLARDFEY